VHWAEGVRGRGCGEACTEYRICTCALKQWRNINSLRVIGMCDGAHEGVICVFRCVLVLL
jgi:hypothetical protein